ncbi:uncharacterized protein N7515_003573 [Penicillium bovifimosum]|uniref:Uncharacterized protein n=1 Tax=Penicillium bovifimosum TaxID=126998 RepID=A0A9W9H4Y2_9EURO|nr:uncharacterized protein N7515_003573 [Penicillium bovifimosum]KAJ5138725.1 hypothetical protein N7515_003573 [Penicillium bovifimosum]
MPWTRPVGEQWAAELVKTGCEHPEWQNSIELGLLWLIALLVALKLIAYIAKNEYKRTLASEEGGPAPAPPTPPPDPLGPAPAPKTPAEAVALAEAMYTPYGEKIGQQALRGYVAAVGLRVNSPPWMESKVELENILTMQGVGGGVKDVAADDEGVATAGDEAPAGPAQPMVMPEASTAGAPTYKVLGLYSLRESRQQLGEFGTSRRRCPDVNTTAGHIASSTSDGESHTPPVHIQSLRSSRVTTSAGQAHRVAGSRRAHRVVNAQMLDQAHRVVNVQTLDQADRVVDVQTVRHISSSTSRG